MYKYIFRLSAFTTKVVEILKKLCILHNFILTKKVHVNQEAIHLRSKSRDHTLKDQKTKKSSKCQETFLHQQNCGLVEQSYRRNHQC